jgi:hypothetical protein
MSGFESRVGGCDGCGRIPAGVWSGARSATAISMRATPPRAAVRPEAGRHVRVRLPVAWSEYGAGEPVAVAVGGLQAEHPPLATLDADLGP